LFTTGVGLEDASQGFLEAPSTSSLQVGSGQIVNGFILIFASAGHILVPSPLGSLKTSIVAHLGLANGIHHLVGQLDVMELVKGDLGVGQVLPHAADVSLGHIDAGVSDLIALALVVGKSFREPLRGMGIATKRCKNESSLSQVMHQRDVVMASPTRGIIDTNSSHRALVFTGLCLGDMMIHYPPQGPVIGPELPCGGQYRHGLGQREGEGFKQQRETATRAGPRHFHLSGFFTTATAHLGHLHMNIRGELEEVQMPPGTWLPVMDRLIGLPAARTR
jgi:hypothetical protein